MKLHTSFIAKKASRMARSAIGSSLQFSALAFAAMTLVGCGGGDEADSAEERVQSVASIADLPESVADQLIARELAGQKADVQNVVAKDAAGAAWLGKNRSYCLPDAVNPVYVWNELALDAARVNSMSDVKAARLYAMVNVAMYDAVNGIETRRGGRRAVALVPADGAPREASLTAAAAAAARAVLVAIDPTRQTVYDAQLQADLDALRNTQAKTAGANWGQSVGAQVVALRSSDRPSVTLPAAPTSTIGFFSTAFTWGGVDYASLKPFAIANSSAYIQAGPPAQSSPEYAAAWQQVRTLGEATPENAANKVTYQFWAAGAGTAQPAGEWVKVALSLVRRKELSVASSARLMALMGMSLSDVVAPTMSTKLQFNHWRPLKAIQQADLDSNPATPAIPTWMSNAGSAGTSPEYISGHSSFAGAGSTVLKGFFCDDSMSFSLQADAVSTAPVNATRTYSSFTSAAEEAGFSRILGGVHFNFSNVDGLKLGRGVAAEVLSTRLLFTQGDTHRGRHSGADCPR